MIYLVLFQNYLITLPDGHMLNVPELKEIRSNITTIRLMTDEDVEAKNIINKWKKDKKFLNADQYRYAQDVTSPNRLKVNSRENTIISTSLKKYIEHF